MVYSARDGVINVASERGGCKVEQKWVGRPHAKASFDSPIPCYIPLSLAAFRHLTAYRQYTMYRCPAMPKDLLHEMYGVQYVRDTLNMITNLGGERRTVMARLFAAFLNVTSHSVLLSCLSVDEYVGDLYSYISAPVEAEVSLFC